MTYNNLRNIQEQHLTLIIREILNIEDHMMKMKNKNSKPKDESLNPGTCNNMMNMSNKLMIFQPLIWLGKRLEISHMIIKILRMLLLGQQRKIYFPLKIRIIVLLVEIQRTCLWMKELKLQWQDTVYRNLHKMMNLAKDTIRKSQTNYKRRNLKHFQNKIK